MLTLLALISGLGLSAQPALAAEASVVSVAAAGDVEDCQAVAIRPLEIAQSALVKARESVPCRPAVFTLLTPSVQLQADRARE